MYQYYRINVSPYMLKFCIKVIELLLLNSFRQKILFCLFISDVNELLFPRHSFFFNMNI